MVDELIAERILGRQWDLAPEACDNETLVLRSRDSDQVELRYSILLGPGGAEILARPDRETRRVLGLPDHSPPHDEDTLGDPDAAGIAEPPCANI